MKMCKHHAILGLKPRGDGDTRDARRALFIFTPPINCRCSSWCWMLRKIAFNLVDDGDWLGPAFSSGPSAFITELSSVPGGASLVRLADGGDTDDAWAVASSDDWASSTIPLPWSAVCQWTGGRGAYNWDRIAYWLYSRTWCLIWRSLRELEGCPLPTDRRTTLPTQWCHHAGHFMTASRAQCACVWLHSVAAAATS